MNSKSLLKPISKCTKRLLIIPIYFRLCMLHFQKITICTMFKRSYEKVKQLETFQLKTLLTSVSDEEVMKIVIGVRIFGLKREHPSVGGCVELDDGLHRQRTVDEIRGFVVHVLHLDDDSLIVGVWGMYNKINIKTVKRY